jgi:hypothetical protein
MTELIAGYRIKLSKEDKKEFFIELRKILGKVSNEYKSKKDVDIDNAYIDNDVIEFFKNLSESISFQSKYLFRLTYAISFKIEEESHKDDFIDIGFYIGNFSEYLADGPTCYKGKVSYVMNILKDASRLNLSEEFFWKYCINKEEAEIFGNDGVCLQ